SISSITTPPTPETSPLSLHDALPISSTVWPFGKSALVLPVPCHESVHPPVWMEKLSAPFPTTRILWLRARGRTFPLFLSRTAERDRKSTRLNSSHLVISYAVFCLKKI